MGGKKRFAYSSTSIRYGECTTEGDAEHPGPIPTIVRFGNLCAVTCCSACWETLCYSILFLLNGPPCRKIALAGFFSSSPHTASHIICCVHCNANAWCMCIGVLFKINEFVLQCTVPHVFLQCPRGEQALSWQLYRAVCWGRCHILNSIYMMTTFFRGLLGRCFGTPST